jgi:hypothetical protein
VFSKDLSADWLLGVRPSALSVSNAVAMAASWATVVSEADSIVSMSVRSAERALDSAELDELLGESDDDGLDEQPDEPLAAVVDESSSPAVPELAVVSVGMCAALAEVLAAVVNTL